MRIRGVLKSAVQATPIPQICDVSITSACVAFLNTQSRNYWFSTLRTIPPHTNSWAPPMHSYNLNCFTGHSHLPGVLYNPAQATHNEAHPILCLPVVVSAFLFRLIQCIIYVNFHVLMIMRADDQWPPTFRNIAHGHCGRPTVC